MAPWVDIHHGMFDVLHDAIFLDKLVVSPRLPLAPCHICSCWYHGELVCLDCHRPGTLGQQNREVLASQWDVWQLKHMADQFSNEKTMKGSWKRPFISQWFWGYDFCTIRDTNEDPISGPGFRQCCALLDCCSEVSKVFTVILLCAWFVYSILWPCFRRKAPSFDFFNLLHYRRMLRTGNMTSSTWSSRPLCWLSHWWVDTAWGVFKSQS